jgi:hypothetical protein
VHAQVRRILEGWIEFVEAPMVKLLWTGKGIIKKIHTKSFVPIYAGDGNAVFNDVYDIFIFNVLKIILIVTFFAIIVSDIADDFLAR